MRFPFPERIQYGHAFIFAVVLLGAQLIEGTAPAMAGLVFCFILVSVAAFNIAGGMYYPSGAFIGINAFMTLVLPMVAKVLLMEPGNRNLIEPIRTVEVYICGMIAMLLAAVVTRNFRKANALLSDQLPTENLTFAYRGCVVFSYIIGFLSAVVASGSGSIGSFLGQVNKFPNLAYLLGVVSTVYFSRRRKSMTWPLLALILLGASSGLFTFSKEAFLAPFFCWGVGVAFMRYRLNWVNILSFSIGMYLAVVYMVPYAQVGRNTEVGGRSVFQISGYMLTHMNEVREAHALNNESSFGGYHDYDRPIGLLDRLDILPFDDALISQTDRSGRFFGYFPIIAAFDNAVPHLLWPDKPLVYFGNTYGHEIGVLGGDDYATGISFSFASDAYHEGGIFCLLVLCAPIFALIFVVLDSVVGDSRRNPVCLVMTVLIFRAAAEGNLTVAINLIEQPLFGVVFVSYVTKYVLPVIGRLFSPRADDTTNILPQAEPAPSL